jgi:DNA-binding winged helix-turn-helix (wHTH) protein
MESLRRRIERFRRKVGALATAAGDRAPALDEIVETVQGRGYRLNPDRVRIVELTEVDFRKPASRRKPPKSRPHA